MSAELKGDKALLKQLRSIADNTPSVSAEALREWAKDVRRDGRDEAPVDTGTLRKSLALRVDKNKLKADVGYWGKNLKAAYYVWWVHDGTQRIEGNNFLDRAFQKNQDLRPYLQNLAERLIQ